MLWKCRLGETAPGIGEDGFRECPHCAGDCISSGDTGLSRGVDNEPIPIFYFSNCCDGSAPGPHTAERADARVGWNNRAEEPK